MRAFILAGTSLLALSALAVAKAAPITFGYTGGLQSYTVPVTGLYDILAFGGTGGNVVGAPSGQPYSYSGGVGAEIGGDFQLTAGEILSIAVAGGGASNSSGGGGGGGSFVVAPGNTPLIVAGGGGGAIGSGEVGAPAQLGTAGGSGNFALGYQGAGGVGGSGGGAPGTNDNGGGGGGGGFYGSGANALGVSGFSNGQLLTFISGYGGSSLPSLAGGTSFVGIMGGFGGGGGGFGGGGGGYSGGGGGGLAFNGYNAVGGGGGGGSFDGGLINADRILILEPANAYPLSAIPNNGSVTITQLSATAVPEPGSLALFGMGLFGALMAARHRGGRGGGRAARLGTPRSASSACTRARSSRTIISVTAQPGPGCIRDR